MEDVGQELALVSYLLSLLIGPGHLALALHLGVHEVTYVVPAVWPLEFAVAHNLAILHVASVCKYEFLFHLLVREYLLLHPLVICPLFEALSAY